MFYVLDARSINWVSRLEQMLHTMQVRMDHFKKLYKHKNVMIATYKTEHKKLLTKASITSYNVFTVNKEKRT